MNQQDPKEIPFTEDPTQKELTSFATFTKSSYTSKFCDHVIDEEGSVYRVEDEKSEDPEVQKANKLLVVEEKRGQGEGLIERKDLYTFCRGFLENEGKNFLRGYWAVGTEDTSAETTSPLPVLQFGTLGLEIHPEKKGIIKSVQRIPQFSQLLAVADLEVCKTRDLGRGDHLEDVYPV